MSESPYSSKQWIDAIRRLVKQDSPMYWSKVWQISTTPREVDYEEALHEQQQQQQFSESVSYHEEARLEEESPQYFRKVW